jgi:hypothetical protein
MESAGEAFRIHISEATRNLLDRLGGYYCEERGLTQIKVQLLPGVYSTLLNMVIDGVPVWSINSLPFVKKTIHLLQ